MALAKRSTGFSTISKRSRARPCCRSQRRTRHAIPICCRQAKTGCALLVIILKRPHGARLFFVMRGSILPRIAPALLTCTALAIVVTVTHGFLFHWKVTLTSVPFTLIGLALAIFLGFR